MAYYYNILNKNNYIKAICTTDMVHEIIASESNADNTTIRKSCVDFTPLLEGHVQFGKLGTVYKKNIQ